jgi:hypothetical protein
MNHEELLKTRLPQTKLIFLVIMGLTLLRCGIAVPGCRSISPPGLLVLTVFGKPAFRYHDVE